jgi:tetratricopeptide (TPR) repeat protein
MMHDTDPTPAIAEQYGVLIDTLCSIAEAYYYCGRLDDALQLLDAGAQILDLKEVGQHSQISLLLQLGKLRVTKVFLSNGDFDSAMAALSRARHLAETTQNRRQLGVALNLIGQAHHFRSLNNGDQDWDTPQAYFQQALEHSQAAGDMRGTSESLFQLGLMHERKQQHDSASAYYQQVIELANQYDYKQEKSFATRHLAGIFQGRGELDQALRLFEESLALREEIGLKLYLPFASISVGDVLYDQGHIAEALARYQAAFELAEEMELQAGLIAASLSMGYAHKEQQDSPQALACFERARDLARAIGLQRGIAAAEAEIAELTKRDQP